MNNFHTSKAHAHIFLFLITTNTVFASGNPCLPERATALFEKKRCFIDPPQFEVYAQYMKALLVDDDFNFCKILLEFLQPYGKHDTAGNGYEAIEKFLTGLENSRPYDLVCLDVMMNELDGLKALNVIRSIEKIKKVEPVKLILVTALEEDEVNGLNQNIESATYLQKPVKKADLLKSIKKLGVEL